MLCLPSFKKEIYENLCFMCESVCMCFKSTIKGLWKLYSCVIQQFLTASFCFLCTSLYWCALILRLFLFKLSMFLKLSSKEVWPPLLRFRACWSQTFWSLFQLFTASNPRELGSAHGSDSARVSCPRPRVVRDFLPGRVQSAANANGRGEPGRKCVKKRVPEHTGFAYHHWSETHGGSIQKVRIHVIYYSM